MSITFLLLLLSTSAAARRPNTPPVFDFKREWILSASDPVGSRVATVRTRDMESDPIRYGLQPALYMDGSSLFSINSTTGVVTLASPLTSRPAGTNVYLYVTADDGQNVAKIEVLVRIEDGSVHSRSNNNSPGRGYPFAHVIDLSSNSSRSPHPYPAFNLPRGHHPWPPSSPPMLPPRPKDRPPRPSSSSTSSSTTSSTSSTISPPQSSDPPANTSRSSSDSSPSPGSTSPPTNTSTNPPNSSSAHRMDILTAFLPLLAAAAFAPLVGGVFYLLHRRCSRREAGREANLMKSLSQKAGINWNTSLSTAPSEKSLSFARTSSELEYNGAMFSEMRSISYPAEISSRGGGGGSWEFPRHHLRFLGILGEGCFGQVWKCEAVDICGSQGTSIVAVKTLKENASEKERKDLLSELEVMKLLDPHPNVVTLLGSCRERDPVFLIMEFVPHGKLQSYLRESRTERFYGNTNGVLSCRDLTSFAYQIAKGMEYIASKGIIHRDLAARNVLIGSGKSCKIADFGFARDVIENNVYERKSEGRLPIRWMAPESLYDNLFTSKSDVWSFGITMWEIVTLGSTPYPGLAAGEVMRRVKDGVRLEKPEHCKREVYNIMFYCWEKEPAGRPSFPELVDMLDKLLISENDYIELDRFPDHSYYNIITNMSGEKL